MYDTFQEEVYTSSFKINSRVSKNLNQ